MKKRAISLLLSAALLLSLSACGGGAKTGEGSSASGGEKSGESTAAKEENAKNGAVATVTIWSPTDLAVIEQWWTEHIDQWNKEHPDIQVKREAIDRSDSYAYENKITTAMTSGDLPDILFVDGPTISYYAENQTIIPIDDVWTEEDKKDFVASTVQQDSYNGHMYAMGPTESSVALYYN
mgnify:FL=1